jgi:hypothetical protein
MVVLLILVALLGAGAVAMWATVRRGFSARENPSALEALVARPPLCPALPQ